LGGSMIKGPGVSAICPADRKHRHVTEERRDGKERKTGREGRRSLPARTLPLGKGKERRNAIERPKNSKTS